MSILMAALMLQPSVGWAGSSAAVVGSMNTYGAVTVGQTAAPATGTVFAGDTVKTQSGRAVVQYEQGARILLAKSSTAVFSPKAVELRDGQMTFQSGSANGMVFSVTSLRLEPLTAKTAAAVAVKDGQAEVSVREGSVRAVDPSGKSLAVIPAGEVKLFAMASAPARAAAAPAAPAASASAAAPPIPAALLAWIIIPIVGATLTTIIATQEDDDEEFEDNVPAGSPVQ